MHVYIKYFLISQSFLFQRRFIFVLLNNGRKVSVTVLFLSAILRKKYNNMHRKFIHFNFYVDMVRTILKKSWMSEVVLKILEFSQSLWKVLDFFIWSWKVLEFHYFVDAAPFTVQLDSFAKEKFGLSSMYEPAQQNNAIYFCASDDNVCNSIYCESRFFYNGIIWFVLGLRTCKTKQCY